MSHFTVLVLIDSPENYEEKVSEALAPFDENDEMFRDNSRWDWYSIGGRWAGLLGNYDPRTDKNNYEKCFICSGTGSRPDTLYTEAQAWARTPDPVVPYPVIGTGCNACYGTGMSDKFSMDAPQDTNMRKVSEIPDDVSTMAVLTPDGVWHERARMGWWGAELDNEKGEKPKNVDEWTPEFKALLAQYPDHTAVLVDCHV